MATLIWFALFLGLALTLAYRRSSLATITFAIGALLLAWSTSDPGFGWLLFAWGTFGLVAVALNTPVLRRDWLSKGALAAYRRITPEMSDTERDALEAGTVWWDGDLFTGNPDWNKLLAVPKPKLSAEEESFLANEVETLCGMLDEWRITHEYGDLPPEVWAYLKEKGFFAMIIEKKYGGKQFSAYGHSQVLIKIASRSSTAAAIVAVPNSLGPAELLHRYGTEEQKQHYLPRLADGRDVPCFALTSPVAGSDAGAIPDSGVVCRGTYEGKEVLGIRLNFAKRYITLAPVATVVGLAFKLYDPERLLGGEEDYGITCALLPRGLPGMRIGRRHFPLNVPFQNGPIWGEDVFIPVDFIIGGPKMAGQGWRMLVECLSAGRSISLPSNTTGGSKLGVYATGAYARIRKQFKTSIGRFEGVEEVIARMGGTLYAMDAVRTMTVGAVDLGEVPSVPGAIAKCHVTEMARQVANDAMDVHGGKGIMLGPKNYLGRGYQAVPVAITVEGANILTRSMIIFGQGAIRCHPWVLKEMRAAALDDPKQALIQFDEALWGHIGFAISNAARSLVLSATHARWTHAPVDGPTRRYYQHINRYSAAFALAADFSMLTLGGSLKFREKISARLGDMLSYLYIASAVLKRYEDDGRQPDDLPFVHWACRTMIYRLQEQLHGLIRNFPNPVVAGLMRFLVFPLGRKYSAPSDQTGRDIVELLISPSKARERLCQGVYIGPEDQQIGLLTKALKLAHEAEPIEKRIRAAQKKGQLPRDERVDLVQAALDKQVIDAAEARLLRDLDHLTMQVVHVDDFDHMELGTKAVRAFP